MLNGEIRLKKPWPVYRKLSFLVVLLAALGVLLVYDITFLQAGQKYNDQYFFLKRQLLWVMLGFACFLGALRINLDRWRRYARISLLVAIALLFLVLVIGREINGAKRWFSLGFFNFQPSEFAKLAVIFYLADFLARKERVITNPVRIFMPTGLLVGLAGALILKEPDYGTAALVLALLFILYFIAGAPRRLLFLGILVLAVLGGLFVIQSDYHRKKMQTWLNPGADPLGAGYQINSSLLAVGSGGIFGRGLGQGQQKYDYLPEPHTDFIFANIAEELGLIGSLLFLSPFFLLIHLGLETARRSADLFRFYLGTGLTSLLALQTLIHLGVVLSLLPNKGLTLPFISYGGSSLLFTFLGTGLLVNLARDLPPDEPVQ
ncbi:MAG TPA: putative lipid II flippase FtsW [bacterium]|uniref:Probable peptidoglycan glycosyltransferase FtsW n=1 Tax=candidate division TA06 bacterium ADurb.Bin417 TaxID=1852828 RepID=A0A1V5M7R3_UNCT6|nr:MAG: Lipid II flippase FtsW [candidate division TA06 bacterium ADurb.Bin417]HNQ34665.1 putative lipid II flippase FtsW [bacterium]HNS49014.1 putative lipid II flippase FtsW [bacterium]